MKKLKYILLSTVASMIMYSCEFDNYDQPESLLQGNIVYNGEAINVSYNDVVFQLWEPGWQLEYPIDVTVDQDGSYSAKLFNGEYKLIIPSSQGPFRTKTNSTSGNDTIPVKVDGNKTMDIEVEPYYMVRNTQISTSGNKVNATFQAEQIITDTDAKSIERVNLYINKTQFVDFRTNVASAEIAGADIADPNSISMSADVPELVPTQNYVYARVGIKISGIEDMIFSPVQKIIL